MTFAEKLKQLREQAGFTQASLAQACGLSLGVVRDYEQGRKEPAMRNAFKLAKMLGVSCEAFRETLTDDEGDTDAPSQSKAKKPKKGKRKG